MFSSTRTPTVDDTISSTKSIKLDMKNKKKKNSRSSRTLESSECRQTQNRRAGGGDGDGMVKTGWGEQESDTDQPMRFEVEQEEESSANRLPITKDVPRPDEAGAEDDPKQDDGNLGETDRRTSTKKQKRKRRSNELGLEHAEQDNEDQPTRESAAKAKSMDEREDESVGDPIGAPHPARSQSGSGPEIDILPVAPPAISHKEQRKRRKLARQGQASDQPADERAVVGTSRNESIFTTSARTKYGVWVGNMLFTTSAAELHGFFEPCGKVCRLNMPPGKREHEHNKGFAYVDFETEQAQQEALAKSETSLAGRKLLIKRATDYTGRPTAPVATDADPSRSEILPKPATVSKTVRKILDRQKQPPAPCLYLGNLGFEATTESITAMFEAHHRLQQVWKPKPTDPSNLEPSLNDNLNSGTGGSGGAGIRKVRMGSFEDTGRCKGFAFVDFHSVQQATSALTDPKNHTLDGRSLVVEFASPDAVRRGGGDGSGGGRGGKANGLKVGVDYDKPKKRAPRDKTSQADVIKQSESSAVHKWTAPIDTTEDSNTLHTPRPEPAPKNPTKLAKPKQAFQGRLKPGAALANARRAKVGIVRDAENIGKKIVFE